MLPFGSIRIGKILGIDVEINYTWFLIFFLVVISFSFIFRQDPYNIPLAVSVVMAVATSLLFFGSVLIHEVSHSFVAKRNQIDIKKITLFIFGGVAQMADEPSTPQIEFKMAIAGPLTSLFFALFFGAWWGFFSVLNLGIGFSVPFGLLAQINLGLAIFNLLPGFPLDGGRVARAALWYFLKDIRRATRIASYGGQAVALTLIFTGFLLFFVAGVAFQGLWLILIGWFLNHAAQSSYRQMELQYSLSDVKVGEIMVTDVITVDPGLTIDRIVDEYFLRHKVGRLPVVENGNLIGIVTLHDVKEVPREEWPTKTAGQVATLMDEEIETRPEEEVFKALMKMAKAEVGHLLVVENGHLIGLITKSDILRLIRVRTELGE